MEITIRVCDVCLRREVPAKRYKLTVDDGREIVKDLCTADAAPWEALLGDTKPNQVNDPPGADVPPPGTEPAPASRPAVRRSSRRDSTRFSTPEEIERKKIEKARQEAEAQGNQA